MRQRVQRFKPPDVDYEVRIIGARPRPLRDFYHLLLRSSWAFTVATIAVVFFISNALFAEAYVLAGGVAHAAPGSFRDAFFFSVQTMGTVGYGAMYPESEAAHHIVVLETLVGLVLTALSTGLVFAKFSRPTARIEFSKSAVISPMDGVPTVSFRIGNARGNQIVDAQFRATLTWTHTTLEGKVFYRSVELRLERDRALSLQRSWTLRHTIDEASPLHGETPESMVEREAELNLLVVGLDDTMMQTVHASRRYDTDHVLWGARHADVLSIADDGAIVLDVRRFHDVEPTEPSDAFPYPR